MSNPDPAGDVHGSPDRQGDDPLDQQLSSYSFDLPEAAIAQRPVEPRHAARCDAACLRVHSARLFWGIA
jgi:hypothetical protein